MFGAAPMHIFHSNNNFFGEEMVYLLAPPVSGGRVGRKLLLVNLIVPGCQICPIGHLPNAKQMLHLETSRSW